MGLTEDAKPRHKAYLVKKEGLSEEEAERRAQFERKDREFYRIVAYQKSSERIYFDDVTQKLLDPPKEVPAHNLILENAKYLYIPEASGHAILFAPSGMGNASWVSMRFGKCRKTQ